jgi:hypothetical protein
MKNAAKLLCGLVLLGLSYVAPAHSQSLFFQPPTYAGTGGIFRADFNGDGKLDLSSSTAR